MRNEKRGQISVEYIIIAGFVGFLVISILGVAYFYSNSIKDKIKVTQIQNFAQKIITSGESVFYAGEPSRVTINAYLPTGVKSINVEEGNQLVIVVSTSSGENTMAFSSNVEIEIPSIGNSGEIKTTEGLKKIKITALSDHVDIRQV